MSQSNRRAFLGQIGSAAIAIPALGHALRVGGEPSLAAAPQAGAAAAQASASASYDLLIAGGRGIDPAPKLSTQRDVPIVRGKIGRGAANIPPNQTRERY